MPLSPTLAVPLLLALVSVEDKGPEPADRICSEGEALELSQQDSPWGAKLEREGVVLRRSFRLVSISGCSFRIHAFRASGLVTLYLESGLEVLLPVNAGEDRQVVLTRSTGQRKGRPDQLCDSVSHEQLRRSTGVTLIPCASQGMLTVTAGAQEGAAVGLVPLPDGESNVPCFEGVTISPPPHHGYLRNIGAFAHTTASEARLATGYIELK